MAITFEEQWDEGGEVEGLSPDTYEKTLRYYAHCTDNETYSDVRTAAKAELPTKYFNLVRTSVAVPRRVTFDTVFEVILDFRHPGVPGWAAPSFVDDIKLTISSSGESGQTMKFSKEAQQVFPGSTAPVDLDEDHKRAIKVDKHGEVEGWPVDSTSMIVEVETIKSGDVVTPRYLIDCAKSRGKVNEYTYRGFPRGSLRLISFSAVEQVNPGTSTATDEVDAPSWTLKFAFDFRPEETGKIKMKPYEGASVEVDYRREGHWLLDVFSSPSKAEVNLPPGSGSTAIHYHYPVIRHALIHRLYDYEDFETLLQI
tara:strand:+ start:13970 stop:14905 length:936 start_codon:yes stop_codon:yes gene_type:complete